MKDQQLFDGIATKLRQYQFETPLPGLSSINHEESFIRQICDSIKRIKYIDRIKQRDINPNRIVPHHILFDPLRASIYHMQSGNIDEAFWLTFLFVHFGKNLRSGYDLLRNVYGKLGANTFWTWENVVNDIEGFRDWLDTNNATLKAKGSFGNHRKFQSLNAHSNAGTGATIESYVTLIGRNHRQFLESIDIEIANDPRELFDFLFKLFVSEVKGFARLAAFDYVTMIGKIGLATVEPRSPYIQKATGPKDGTKLLFGTPNATAEELNSFLKDLGDYLQIPFSMQVVEDAVCNWQKSPDRYRLFKG